jgi:pilus assembly protein CpaE
MRSTRARVLLVDADNASLSDLERQLEVDFEVVGAARTGEEAIRLVEDHSPDIVVIEEELPGMTGLETARDLTRRFPKVSSVILGSCDDFQVMREAMAAGARDYLPRPFRPTELRDVVRKQAASILDQRPRRDPGDPAPGCGLWVSSSPCGGLGKTTLLLSVAAELVDRGGSVLVVDLDLVFGAVSFYTGIEPGSQHLGALLQREVLLPHVVDEFTHEHPAGFRILVGPGHAFATDGRRPGRLIEVILQAVERYDHVLVDLPTGIPDGYLDLLDRARMVLLPMAADIGALRKVRAFWKLLGELDVSLASVFPIILGEAPRSPAVRDAQRLLHPLGARHPQVLPRDRATCEAAALASMPVSCHAPDGAYARALSDALDVVVAGGDGEPLALPAHAG